MRLVLDTNVLVAAFVTRGMCHELLEHCKREHTLATSRRILDEFERTLVRKLRVPSPDANDARSLLEGEMECLAPTALAQPASTDPDDDWILATALEGKWECIVTGDTDLLTLQAYQGVRILTPAEFWRCDAAR